MMSERSGNLVRFPHRKADFESFWQVYPKKVGKVMARAKWDAITGDGLVTRSLDRDSNTYIDLTLKATPEEILEGAIRYRKSQIDPQTYKLIEGGRFTSRPATWLNQGRWEDEDI